MAPTIYMGRSGSGKSYACYAQIKELLQQDSGTPIVLLVPDTASYMVERELANFMECRGFTSVRVVGFSRLAYQVFQAAGIQREPVLSDVSENIIIRSILKRREKELTLVGQVARQPHFADTLKVLFSEMKAFRVTPEDLQHGAESVNSLVLKRKLADLALLFDDYQKTLETRFNGGDDAMEKLIQLIPTSSLVKGAYVFIDGFQWFTPRQLQLLQTLIASSKDSVITITLPPEDKEKYSRKGTLFNRSWETYEELLNLYGNELKIRPFVENHRCVNSSLCVLEREFFTTPTVLQKDNQGISLWNAANRQREVDKICRQILLMMQTSSYRWKDFAIMLRESETYGDILEKALANYEIPFFTDRRHPMMTHPLAELTEGLFAVAKSHFGHDALFRILKTDLFPLAREDVDQLENYCLEFGVSERSWLSDTPWAPWRKKSEEDPLAVEDEMLPIGEIVLQEETAEEQRLRRVNATRAMVKGWLQPFLEFSSTIHTGSAWCEAIFNLLSTLKVPATLSSWTSESEETQNIEEKAAHEQMYRHVITLLEDIAMACGDDQLTLDEMSVLVSEGLESATYSLVPPTLDHVTITTVERSYTAEFRVVFVPGLNDGVFPQRMGDEGLLRDAEREELRAGGISLAAGAMVQAFNENFLLYLACTRAKESLYLSYAANDALGGALEVSLPVRRLEKANYCQPAVTIPLDITEGAETEYVWRPRQSLSLLSQQLQPLRKGEPIQAFWWQLYEWARSGDSRTLLERAIAGVNERNVVPIVDSEVVQQLLLHNHVMTGSVTRLEKYQACPFSFYAQYGLKLSPRRVRSFSSPEIGTFLHENLRKMGEYLLLENRQWRDLDADEREALCSAMATETAEELSEGILNESAYYVNLKERLERTLRRTVHRLSEWSTRSVFNTIAVEQDFGRTPEGWEPLYIPIGKDVATGEAIAFRLQGQIDRLDTWEHEGAQYALVVDYKSGSAGISGQDVYYGLKLQLLTYLLAVEKSGPSNIAPAALVYTYVKNPQSSADVPLSEIKAQSISMNNATIKNSGYFTSDKGVLEALDCEVAGKTPSDYVPIRMDRNGKFWKKDEQIIKSRAQFNVLTNYTERVLEKTGEHILAGHFPISPYFLKKWIPCTYCQFKAVCRFEPTGGDTKYRYLDSLNEEQSMESMQKGGTVYEVDHRTTSRY